MRLGAPLFIIQQEDDIFFLLDILIDEKEEKAVVSHNIAICSVYLVIVFVVGEKVAS